MIRQLLVAYFAASVSVFLWNFFLHVHTVIPMRYSLASKLRSFFSMGGVGDVLWAAIAWPLDVLLFPLLLLEPSSGSYICVDEATSEEYEQASRFRAGTVWVTPLMGLIVAMVVLAAQ